MADLTITAANVKTYATTDSQIGVGQAGEAITQGQPAYKSGNKYYKGDANASEATAGVTVIALTAAATDGQFIFQKGGGIDLGATLTVGETYVVSATAGGIAPIGDLTTGDYTTILGTASTASRLDMKIVKTGIAKA